MNVGETFLHQTENHQLHIRGQSIEILRNDELNINSTAFFCAVNVPAERSGKSSFVQERGMQKV